MFIVCLIIILFLSRLYQEYGQSGDLPPGMLTMNYSKNRPFYLWNKEGFKKSSFLVASLFSQNCCTPTQIVHTMEKEKNGLGRLTHSNFKAGSSLVSQSWALATTVATIVQHFKDRKLSSSQKVLCQTSITPRSKHCRIFGCHRSFNTQLRCRL